MHVRRLLRHRKCPNSARSLGSAISRHIGFSRTWEDLRWARNNSRTRHGVPTGRRILKRRRRSGLSRTKYCRDHRLNKATFDRWLKQLEGAEAARKATELLREQRRQRRRRGPSPLCKSKRSIAVQAFWAMHVEALNWSGLCATHCANAHNLRWSVCAASVICSTAAKWRLTGARIFIPALARK